MENEIWKDIPGHNGYKVSNLGRVKNSTRILKPEIMNKGYERVKLQDKKIMVHRLVAMAFIPNPDNLPQINHKNEIKSDNRVENLEWCNATYNMNYGTRPILFAKQIEMYNEYESVVFVSIRDAARQTGIARQNISSCLNGKIKKAGGYCWRFV